MKTVSVKITSVNQVIAVKDIEQFDTIDEAIAHVPGGQTAVLSLVNTQYKTNLMNAIRQAANPKKTVKQIEAELFAQPDFFDRMKAAGAMGDQTKIRSFIDGEVAILKAKYDKKSENAAVETETPTEEEGDD